MRNGKWIPISKYFKDSLPKNRKYTELEAMYSIQLDYSNNEHVTVSGYASLWGWSRNKVAKFLIDHEIVICYEEDTKSLKKHGIFPNKKTIDGLRFKTYKVT